MAEYGHLGDDADADEGGTLLMIALLVGMPLLGATLLHLVARRNPTMSADDDVWALVGLLAGFIIGAVSHWALRRRST